MASGPDDPSLEHSGADSTIMLLRRAKEGDDDARDTLFRRLTPIVRRWTSGRLPGWARFRSDSDDLVQDALLATVKNLQHIDAAESVQFYAYLYRTLRNKLQDEIEKARLRLRDSAAPVATPAPSPLETMLDAEALGRYRQALDRLAPEDQAAILLRIELGLSLEETAAELGKRSADAARMAVKRAVKRLVEALQRAD